MHSYFSFVIQIGEQADYLRFLPQKKRTEPHGVLPFLGGPSWIILDFKSFDGHATDGVGFSVVYSCL